MFVDNALLCFFPHRAGSVGLYFFFNKEFFVTFCLGYLCPVINECDEHFSETCEKRKNSVK